MIYQGKNLKCDWVEPGLAELVFDMQGESINKFNATMLTELGEAVEKIAKTPDLKGVLFTSAKDVFFVGADVTEFLTYFKKSEDELVHWLMKVNQTFCTIEDLSCPTVVAINGFALGGGMEFALSSCYRVMSTAAKIGLPEVKLGIYPGWGGTVRLSRVAGADNAIEWIASGNQYGSTDAMKIGAVDAVVAPDKVRAAALDLLKQAMAGKLDWRKRQAEKKAPLHLNQIESAMSFEGSKAFVAGMAGPNYPAPVAAVTAMQKGATLTRDQALPIEARGFAQVARTETASSLVGVFLGDQYLKKESKKYKSASAPIKSTGVLGAGIMGGGIAYQSASTGTPIVMKDIRDEALALGMGESIKLLDKQVSRGKFTTAKMAEVLTRIKPTLSYEDVRGTDLIVEAVVENEKIKGSVLKELETLVKSDTVITSNTSTISITRLAENLKRPENFCGMHFFNPVPKMPLVEVIRGKKSSDRAIATTVTYALSMGKTPIVVNDCPGFLVNRVLFPYFSGFMEVLNDGVDFARVDKIMEKFGWPMGPAYLLDVVGVDTAHHAQSVMAAEFPDRMKHTGRTAIELLYEAKRFGQKNGKGFYKYSIDPKKGTPKKEADPEIPGMLKSLVKTPVEVTDQDIIDRIMLPMIIEASRCLEENIVASPIEVDMGVIYGLGFPPFRGGVLKFADSVGVAELCKRAAPLAKRFGKLYEPTAQMQKLAQANGSFHSI